MRLLSGRYRLEAVSRFWDVSNPLGLCKLCWNSGDSHKADVSSFLCSCSSLSQLRESLIFSSFEYLAENFPFLLPVVSSCLSEDPAQFWVDASTMPRIISEVQMRGDEVLTVIFKLTRNFCFGLHKRRLQLLQTLNVS